MASRRGEERASAEALARSERLRHEVERLAGVGSWEWHLRTDRITWSDELYRIYGLEPGTEPLSFDAAIERVHAQDRARVTATVARARQSGEPYAHVYRVTRADGAERTVLGRGEVVRDARGVPLRMVGTAQDITERAAHDAIHDADLRLIAAGRAMTTALAGALEAAQRLAAGARGALSDPQRAELERILQSHHRLERLAAELLAGAPSAADHE